MAEVELLCIGNAMVDIFAETDGAFCRRFGTAAPVQHVAPKIIDLILGALPQMVYSSGGGAANTAKIAALLGVNAAFAGCVGQTPAEACETFPDSGCVDAFGELFRRDLAGAGVQTLLATAPERTGRCLVLTTPEGVKIAASPGAALGFGPGDIPKAAALEAKVLVLDGYMLGREELVRSFFDAVLQPSDKGRRTAALDVGSVFQVRSQAAEIARFLRDYPLVLFMNEEEAAAFHETLNGKNTGKSETLLNFLEELSRDRPDSIIALKRAERGAVIISAGKTAAVETQPAVPVDSTGAGDAFAAGFLAGFLRGKSPEECAVLGNKAAGIILTVPGTRIKAQDLADVRLNVP